MRVWVHILHIITVIMSCREFIPVHCKVPSYHWVIIKAITDILITNRQYDCVDNLLIISPFLVSWLHATNKSEKLKK